MAIVSAIIPTWNRADLLRSILENLQSQARKPDEVIVVDNGSSDDTPNVIREFGVVSICFPENRGFAVAVNEGISQAVGDWILIVNNDVVLEDNWLEILLESAEKENAAFAAGKLLRPKSQELDGSFDLVSRAAYAWRSGYGKPDSPLWSQARRIWFAPMTAALFKKLVFEQIGMLDTRFESYYEDVDFGVRCAIAGLHGIYEPQAVARHMSKTTLGRSAARVYYLTARNQIFILARYLSARTLLRFAWPILAGQVLALLAAARQRNLFAAMRGKWVGLRRWKEFRASNDAAEAIFRQSEREIFELQKKAGFDIYWRLYFLLVRPG
ncbi:MAG TPA: glycosyltransferase family 2 protein [Bryobacteraceae bacterium]|jgi:GT2 family glycosyltransferase|nr:glycosyltransferase family 2 protein [Bryobacteraceae bacterium]